MGAALHNCPKCGHIFWDDETPSSSYSSSHCVKSYDSTSNYSSSWADKLKPNMADKIRMAVAREMTEAEIQAIREWNFEPTWKGIKALRLIHDLAMDLLERIPELFVRFDRRVPRWRAARWKALT